MKSEIYDYICIGAGSGGIASANRAAINGAKVLLVEAKVLGGTCVNVGCIPKKVMWHGAAMKHELEHYASAYGIDVSLKSFNWHDMCASRAAYIDRIHKSYDSFLASNKVTVVHGCAKFVSNNQVEVAGVVYEAPHILIATGTKPIKPDIAGAELGLDSDEFFALDALPARVAVVGAGYIAVEFAGVLNALGAKTHLLLRKELPLRKFDHSVAQELVTHMSQDGIAIHNNTQIESVAKQADGSLLIKSNSGEIVVDCLVWAIGRESTVDNIGLDNTDVTVDADGYIKVDAYQNTTAKGIYSVGDIIKNGVQLTPVAVKAGRILAMRLFAGKNDLKMDYHNVPSVVFSHPPIGTVGMTEYEAVAEFGVDNIQIYTSNFTPMLSAVTSKRQNTFMKMICLADTGRVVGLHGIGYCMDEMLQGFAVAMKMGATKSDFDSVVAIHPTSSEEFVLMK